MATRKVKLTGTAEWAKVFAQNRDLKGFQGAYEDHDGACTIDLFMDEKNVAALSASRSIKNPKDVGNGLFKTKFVRKFNTGRDWDSGAPTVVKADGSKWDYTEDGVIGNGSTIQVTLSVYDTSRKAIVGTRLDRVKVLEHLKYERDDEEVEVISAPTAVTGGDNVKEVMF